MIQGRMMELLVAIIGCFIGLGSLHAEEAQSVPGEFVVVLKPGFQVNNISGLQAQMNAENITAITASGDTFLVKRNVLEKADFAMSDISADSRVEYVEPNYIYTMNALPDDPSFVELWGLSNDGKNNGLAGFDINVIKAWDITTGSRDVIVGVIDTGVDYTHPDLKDNMWINEAEANGEAGVDDDKNGFVDDIYGYDFANNDGDPLDDHNHGTHVAGTIGAKGNDGVGIVGVNWNVRIMALKFLTGSGSGTLDGAIKAIDYATLMGATFTSNSWGGGAFSKTLYYAIERAKRRGLLFVAAAGNNGKDMDVDVGYPAGYDLENIISVAAVDRSANLASFSNYGLNSVDLGAPGVEIYSSIKNGEYKAFKGTSMACPHVAGVAALVYANEPNLSWQEVKERILNAATPTNSLDGKTVTGGMLNAYGALTGEKAPPNMNNPKNWEKVVVSGESAHPYEANTVQEWVFTQAGAVDVSIYFERFETEVGYDKVEFQDAAGTVYGTWSGKHDAKFSPSVPGDTIKVVFKSDRSVNGFGLIMSQLAFR